jgi:hypothetical protein
MSQRDLRTFLSAGQGFAYNAALAAFVDCMLETDLVHEGEKIVSVQLCDVRAQASRELVVEHPNVRRCRLTHEQSCADLACRRPSHEPTHTLCLVTLESGQEVQIDLTGPQFGDHRLFEGFPLACSPDLGWPVIRKYSLELLRGDRRQHWEMNRVVLAADAFLRHALQIVQEAEVQEAEAQ